MRTFLGLWLVIINALEHLESHGFQLVRSHEA